MFTQYFVRLAHSTIIHPRAKNMAVQKLYIHLHSNIENCQLYLLINLLIDDK